jgi:hypothetical protein
MEIILTHELGILAKNYEKYGSRISELARRIFEEYGLIVCGWSATWDEALRKSIDTIANRRYNSYWTHITSEDPVLREMSTRRGGSLLKIQNADEFFIQLEEKVSALSVFKSQHPLGPAMVKETAKRYLASSDTRIRLWDLVNRETSSTMERVTQHNEALMKKPYNPEVAREAFDFYFETIASVRELIIAGSYYGDNTHSDLWLRILERTLESSVIKVSGDIRLSSIRKYPTMLLLYCVGISLASKNDYRTLAKLLLTLRYRVSEYEVESALSVQPAKVLENQWSKVIYKSEGNGTYHFPLNEHLFLTLAPLFHEYLTQPRFEEAFNRFETLYALSYYDERVKSESNHYVPFGRFTYLLKRERNHEFWENIESDMQLGDASQLIASGLFLSKEDFESRAKMLFDTVKSINLF